DAEQARDGRIRASTLWRPACSFMSDTAAALLKLIEQRVAGTVHLDSNATDAFDFHSLVHALKRSFGRDDWRIEAHEEYVHDQRLLPSDDAAVRLPPLVQRLRT
ncbi:MAG: sugar nucleotide-binding protein, partial [Casimicrobium sp.]